VVVDAVPLEVNAQVTVPCAFDAKLERIAKKKIENNFATAFIINFLNVMKKMVIIGQSNARHRSQGMMIGLEEIRVGLDLGTY
jgi:hypothetical protein